MIEYPVCFDLETIARAQRALDREDNPHVLRAWAALFAQGYIGATPPPPALCSRDYGLRQLAVLLGAEARA